MTKLASALLLAFAANSALADPVVGTSNGTWVDPIPANATFSGVGTSTFLWGTNISWGNPNNTLTFTGFGSPASFNGEIGTPFKVGSLIYHNGTTDPNGLADRVSLQLALNFTVPGFGQIVGTYPFELESTINGTNANQSADYVRLPSTATVKQFEVGGLKYELTLSKFENVKGDGFLTSTGSQFHVREQKTASADLFATVTFLGGGPPPIPEPATYGMMLAGLGALGLMVARRRRYF